MNAAAMAGFPDNYLDLPPFLIVTPEEAARRKKWNAEHPAPPLSSFNVDGTDDKRRSTDEIVARLAAEEKEAARQRSASYRERKRIDEQAGYAETKPMPGTVWNASIGRWCVPDKMSPLKFARLLSEMPTERHREILIQTYGEGQGASLGDDVAKDSKRPAKVPAGTRRAATKSAVKGAGRSRKPDSPSGPVDAPGPATPKPKVAKPPSGKRLSKDEQGAKVRAMLTRPEGASLDEIGAEMGWLRHSASAFLSTQFRNKGEATTKTDEGERGTVYRLPQPKGPKGK